MASLKVGSFVVVKVMIMVDYAKEAMNHFCMVVHKLAHVTIMVRVCREPFFQQYRKASFL